MLQLSKYSICIWLLLLTFQSQAQVSKIQFRDRLGDSIKLVNTALKQPRVKLPPRINRELSVGLRVNTNGWGLFMENAYVAPNENWGKDNGERFFNMRVILFEISERVHPKDMRTSMGGGMALPFQSNSYIYGKVNTFYQMKLGYGHRKMIAGKPEPKTVAIHLTYNGGVAVGFVKPYYLNIQGRGDVKYSDSTAGDFLSQGLITGSSSLFKGFSEMKIVPGLHFKGGLHFDYATKRQGKAAIEAGISAEYYFNKIEQHVGQEPSNLFLGFYLSLQFGKRWSSLGKTP